MTKKTAKEKTAASKRQPKHRDLTDAEINNVFDALQLPREGSGCLVNDDANNAHPLLHFPLSISTPTQPPIDW